jgi:predicted nucleotidyltransferase
MVKKRIPAKIKKVARGYVERLAKEDKLKVNKIIIFGSYAKGTTHKWSDIDVCIISPRFKDEFEALQFLWTRRSDQEVRAGLEPVGFSKKVFKEGSSLIREIERTGVEI